MPAYQARDAVVVQSERRHQYRANKSGRLAARRLCGSPPGSPKPSWGGYWGSWLLGRNCGKRALR
eukprot:2993194-Prymnesium_polylepis.1